MDNVLKVVHTHRPITTIPSHTFQTPVCSILTWVEVFAILFAAEWSVKAKRLERHAVPREPLRPFLPCRLVSCLSLARHECFFGANR